MFALQRHLATAFGLITDLTAIIPISSDSWFSWSDGPQPEGAQDNTVNRHKWPCLVESVAEGTPDVLWEEPFPDLEEATRVAGLLVAEEKLENVTTFVNHLQENDGITYKGGEYSFVNKLSDRNDKKVS